MPNLPDGSLSILASPLPPVTAAKIMLVIFGLLLIVALLHYASPTRLTRVLSDAMSDLDKVFIEVTTAGLLGLLSAEDMQTVVWTYVFSPTRFPKFQPFGSYHMLRIEVGTLQSDALRNSTSWCTSLYSVFTRSTCLFRCIKQVRDFQRRLQLNRSTDFAERPSQQDKLFAFVIRNGSFPFKLIGALSWLEI
ncbi:hypothetical protein B0H16DRAFT_1476924 [Mycena metata]|uniref:Uncharacterized protein n=1 Tax=Mycena metata TaxID=1033252 RepID=A0AAD7MGP4_9AGAR|nr:hypothetical protein B0H16DRAFT_1476924 [Mycena metata]